MKWHDLTVTSLGVMTMTMIHNSSRLIIQTHHDEIGDMIIISIKKKMSLRFEITLHFISMTSYLLGILIYQ